MSIQRADPAEIKRGNSLLFSAGQRVEVRQPGLGRREPLQVRVGDRGRHCQRRGAVGRVAPGPRPFQHEGMAGRCGSGLQGFQRPEELVAKLLLRHAERQPVGIHRLHEGLRSEKVQVDIAVFRQQPGVYRESCPHVCGSRQKK